MNEGPLRSSSRAIGDEALLARDRSFDHPKTQRAAGHRHSAMRRVRARHEMHAVEIERLLELERGSQMAVVDRVEGATENAERSHAIEPLTPWLRPQQPEQ